MAKDISTEQKIAEAAERVFMVKGIAGARMQEIADAAGINKALLHYYFRSKEKLFDHVFDQVFNEFVGGLRTIFDEDEPIESQIRTFIRKYLEIFDLKPDMPLFIQTEIYRNPALQKRFTFLESVFPEEKLRNAIQAKIDAGEWHPIRVSDFLTNLIALSVYPYLARPMLQKAFGMDDPGYEQYLKEREEFVFEFLMRGLRT